MGDQLIAQLGETISLEKWRVGADGLEGVGDGDVCGGQDKHGGGSGEWLRESCFQVGAGGRWKGAFQGAVGRRLQGHWGSRR
jgi:hypothetical protein